MLTIGMGALLVLIGYFLGLYFFDSAIAGLVIAFASQSIISNFIAGIFLFIEQPIKTGDTINIKGTVTYRFRRIN